MSLCFDMPPPITTLSGSSIRILLARTRPNFAVQSSRSCRQQGSLSRIRWIKEKPSSWEPVSADALLRIPRVE